MWRTVLHYVPLMAASTMIMCASARSAPADAPSHAESASMMHPVAAEGVHVSRATTCRNVADREPVDPTDMFRLSDEQVYLWCEVMNAAGTTISHVYSLNGEPVTTVELAVGADRWRTWSAKTLHPHQTGEWTADILAEDGSVLHTTTFTVVDDDG